MLPTQSYVRRRWAVRVLPYMLFIALTGHSELSQGATPAQIDHGKHLFSVCAVCHTLHDGEPDKLGPNLHGIYGSTAGAQGAFAFSPALKQSGIVWSDETLDAWVKRPTAVIKGTKMLFPGMPSDADRADLLSYLKQETN